MDHANTPTDLPPKGARFIEVLLIFLLFFVVGSGFPPAANEAHYLGKARHLWDPEWCPRDEFLLSADAHFAFYWLWGWTTCWMSLESAAWCGRISGWLLLAWAWLRLSLTVAPQTGYGILSAAIWITLVHRCHMSGEWIIDGVEAKIFAYPLVLMGLTDLIHGNWRRTWLWFGAASSLHVLVGGWAVVMALGSWCLQPRDHRPRLLWMLPGLCLGGLFALPGLIPSLLLSSNVDIQQKANEIYVFERLSHHLRIRSFHPWFILRHSLLIAVFLAAAWPLRNEQPLRRMLAFVCCAILLALCGTIIDLLLGSTSLAASILRFYWFRPSDVFVAVGISLLFIRWHSHRKAKRPRLAAWALIVALFGTGADVIDVSWALQQRRIPGADWQGAIRTPHQWEQWQEIGRWCGENLPADALILTPVDHQTFRWYSDRSELVNRKDIPQDAAAISRWHRRRDQSAAWHDALQVGDQPAADRALKRLIRDYAIEYVVTQMPIPLASDQLALLHRNQRYGVFRVRRVTEALD